MLRTALLAVAALALTAAGCRTARPDATAPEATAPDVTTTRPPPAAPTGPPNPPDDARVRGPGQGDPIEIPLGQTVQRDGHAIRFVEIVEDSRCPTHTTCVWEGRAKVAMEIDGTAVTLTVPYGAQRDEEPSSLEIGMIAVEVVGLDPYPGSPDAEAGATPTVRAVTRGAGM